MTLEEKKERIRQEYELLKEKWGKLDNSYLEWSKTRRAMGDCRKERGITTLPIFRIRISLTYIEINNIEIALEVLRHECAHVLAMMEGDYGHGQKWKKWALLLDAVPSPKCKISTLISPKSKYELICENEICKNNRIYRFHRLHGESYYCNDCNTPVTIIKNW